MMSDRPTYEELKKRVKELEEAAAERKKTEGELKKREKLYLCENENKYRLLAEMPRMSSGPGI